MDVCYTNHAEADQDDMDNLLTLLAAAGVTFIMGLPAPISTLPAMRGWCLNLRPGDRLNRRQVLSDQPVTQPSGYPWVRVRRHNLEEILAHPSMTCLDLRRLWLRKFDES